MKFLEDLAARRRFGMKPGLDTMRAIMAALGEPQRRLRSIHIAGTNGKGAVAAMLDACLRASGARVGRYTSPHLVQINERFFLDGRPVDDATLERLAEKTGAAISRPGFEEVTFFEALTAVAFLLYAEAQVDWAVLECGLGGRLDATNVCEPALSVITRIGLDHCDWLGDTLAKIAAEKAGIVKPGIPVVLGANEPEVRSVVADRARDCGSPFFYAPDLVAEDEIPDGFSLGGRFNRENALTALAALKVLTKSVGSRLAPSLTEGLRTTVWPGRFQRVGRFLVDGAHNPPAATALASALKETGLGRLSLVAGFCGDKDVSDVLRILAPYVKVGLAVKTNNPRSLSAEATAERMSAAGILARPMPSLKAALAAARGQTLVCGSLFLAGEALVALGAAPWSQRRFDPAEKLTAAGPCAQDGNLV